MSNPQNTNWYPPHPPNTGQPPQPPPQPNSNNPNQPNTPQQPYMQQQAATSVGAQQQPHDPNQQPPPNGHPDRLPAVAPQQAMVQHQGPPLQPMHPDYRLPMPQQMYGHPYAQPHQGYPPNQPAPRQRTAIACRYCRRRKIRCSGFEHSEDGRCTNCQRFSQECVFTPVSAQTQAFVPAHTVWRGQNPPANAQLYGAYGQPLPPQANRDQYPPQQQQQLPAPPPGQQQQPGQYPPPPPGYQQQPMYGQPVPQEAGRKRGNDEPHTPTLPPPHPDAQANGDADRQDSNRNSRIVEMVDVGIQVELIGSRERGS